MFHQDKVPPNDQDALRFLWWTDNIDDEPHEYVMTSHVFGATDSPSCAAYALKRTAQDNKVDFSKLAVDTVLRNFYVDDMLTAVRNEELAIDVVRQTTELLAKGGFKLTKFASNNRAVMEAIPKESRADPTLDLDFDKLPVQHVVGVKWYTD